MEFLFKRLRELFLVVNFSFLLDFVAIYFRTLSKKETNRHWDNDENTVGLLLVVARRRQKASGMSHHWTRRSWSHDQTHFQLSPTRYKLQRVWSPSPSLGVIWRRQEENYCFLL